MKRTTDSLYSVIYRTVKRIPKGRVATYGQIARLAGLPGQARLVGYALHNLRGHRDPHVPWQRVINARGESSLPGLDAELQRQLLKSEGVIFDRNGRTDLLQFGWKK
jgi:methylated-DNA-protein-cysteine methyltransferase related protein